MYWTLALLFFVVVGSFIAHEYGHAMTAKLYGWKLHGWKFYWYGAGYAVEIPIGERHRLRDIAAGGLAVTFLLLTIGLLVGGWFGSFLVSFNGAMLLVNLIPIPGTDGWYLIRGGGRASYAIGREAQADDGKGVAD